MDWLSHPQAIGRFLVTAFFAVVFVQSALDKLTDREGNMGFFADHFKNSPVAGLVPLLFWSLTALEATAGGLCTLGLLFGNSTRQGMSVAAAGVAISGVALLSLLLGQRLAKDYAGAAVIATYFGVALVGMILFAVPP